MQRTTTENGASSLSTTGDARLDFFTKVCRDTPKEYLETLLANSWSVDPLDTLKLVFHLRDCRGSGKGERKQSEIALRWLLTNHPEVVKANVGNIPFYGRWKDLHAFFGTTYEADMIRFYTTQLQIDLLKIHTGEAASLSLAGKYAPTEGQALDRQYQAAGKFAKGMGVNKRGYRTKVLVPLRRQLDANSVLVERHMTDLEGDWASIDFSKVPSLALKKYKRAFERHQGERYAAYLASVKAGTAKINVGRLMPHQMVGAYVNDHGTVASDMDGTVETQWAAFVEGTRKSTKIGNAIAMVDVSGSMCKNFCSTKSGVAPILVSISLGILLAELATGPFNGKFITFTGVPTLQNLKGSTLHSNVKGMVTGVAENTNIQAAFDLILNSAKMFGCSAEQLPTTLFIFSDMQFDAVSGYGSEATNWDEIKLKYQQAGYKMPRVVFWNLRGDTKDFVVGAEESNVVCLSGFSSDLLRLVVDGESLTPLQMMFRAIHNPRYDRVVLTPPAVVAPPPVVEVVAPLVPPEVPVADVAPILSTAKATEVNPDGCRVQ